MAEAQQERFFEGVERLEGFGPLGGRKMRQGSPAELAVSDRDRILAALEKSDAESALSYLELVHGEHKVMAVLLTEWSLEWCQAMSLASPSNERRCSELAFEHWSNEIQSAIQAGEAEGKLAHGWLARLLEPQHARPGVSAEFRRQLSTGERNAVSPLLEGLEQLQKRTLDAIARGELQHASEAFRAYWRCALTLHDGLVQYAQSYPVAAQRLCGQPVAETVIHRSLASCSYFDPGWGFFGAMNPHQLAAFLAEHLRVHFSGADRGGSVEVIEESDRYRLVFDACGSGGAHRRRVSRAGVRPDTLADPSAATWFRTGEVTPYCAHCAMNELQSIERWGYPIMVTEFEPDPAKPCGWTIYKDPHKIPEAYFTRLRLKRDPTKFKP